VGNSFKLISELNLLGRARLTPANASPIHHAVACQEVHQSKQCFHFWISIGAVWFIDTASC
jgi:hypothetical protein